MLNAETLWIRISNVFGHNTNPSSISLPSDYEALFIRKDYAKTTWLYIWNAIGMA